MSNSSQPKNLYDTLKIDGKSIDDILKEINTTTINLNTDIDNMTTAGYSGESTYDYAVSTPTISLPNTAGGTYTINTLSTIDTITITGLENSSYSFNLPKEWVDCLPSIERVQDMCEKYPGLKIAFENFKVIYEMVKDDYDNPVPKK